MTKQFNQYTEAEWDAAVKELGMFIHDQVTECIYAGFSFSLAPNDACPQNLTQLSEYLTLEGGEFPVNKESSDTAIYPAAVNVLFRFWHDVCHYLYGCEMDYAGELMLGQIHQKQAEKAGLSALARQILYADTTGQLEYYKRFGEFPHNQRAFDESYVQHGKYALTCHF